MARNKIDVNQIGWSEAVAQDVTFANSASFGNNIAISGSLSINQAAAAGSQVFVTTEGKVGIGTSAPAYKLSVGGSMEVGQYIYHKGDNNTWINFTDNRIRLNAGGVNFIDCQDPGSAPHKVRINNGGNNIDFIIKDKDNDVYFTADASTARIGIGTETPEEKLHVAGGLKMDEGRVTVSATEKINKKAISLDGTNDHVLVSDEDDFSFTNGSSDVAFSLSAWVYVGDVSSDDGPFIAKANFSTGNTEFIFKHANGVLQFFLYDRDQSASGHQIRTLANSATLSDTTWHHVVATYSGNGSHTGLKVYTDGSQTTATQSTLNSYTRIRNTSTPLTLGATEDLANANRVFEDRLADCVVFNKELSSSEVTELYNSGKVMNIRNHSAFANVVSWWKMGDDADVEGSGGIRDYVSGHHGTLTNGAAIIDETGLSSDPLDSLKTDASGSLALGLESPDDTLHVYGSTKLEGPLILKERTYDPDNPAEGSSVIWMSNGHGTGDDGDILIKITAGGVTKTATLVDFSAV